MWDVAERAWNSRAKASAPRAVDDNNPSAPQFPTSIFSRQETEPPHTSGLDFSKYEDPLALRRDVMLRRWNMEVESLSAAHDVARQGALAAISHIPTISSDVEQGYSPESVDTTKMPMNWNSPRSIAANPISAPVDAANECMDDGAETLNSGSSVLHKHLEDLLQSSILLRASASKVLVSGPTTKAEIISSCEPVPVVSTTTQATVPDNSASRPLLPTSEISKSSAAFDGSTPTTHTNPNCVQLHAEKQLSPITTTRRIWQDHSTRTVPAPVTISTQQFESPRTDLDMPKWVVHETDTCREEGVRALDTNSTSPGHQTPTATVVTDLMLEGSSGGMVQPSSKVAAGTTAGNPAHPAHVSMQDETIRPASVKPNIQRPTQELSDGPIPTNKRKGQVSATSETPTQIQGARDSISNSYSDAFSEGTGGDGSYSVGFSTSSALKDSLSGNFSNDHVPGQSKSYTSYEENSYSEAFSDLESAHNGNDQGIQGDDQKDSYSGNYSDVFSSPENNAASYSDAFSNSSDAHNGDVRGATKIDDDTYSEGFSESAHSKEELHHENDAKAAAESYSDGFSDDIDDRKFAAEGSAEGQYSDSFSAAASVIEKSATIGEVRAAGIDSYSEHFSEHSKTNESELLDQVHGFISNCHAQNDDCLNSKSDISTATPSNEDSRPLQLEAQKGLQNHDQPTVESVAPEVGMLELITQSGDVSLARTAWEQTQDTLQPVQKREEDEILDEAALPLNQGSNAGPEPATTMSNEMCAEVGPSVIFPIPVRHFQELLVQHCVAATARAQRMLLSNISSENVAGEQTSNSPVEPNANSVSLQKVQQSLVALASCSVTASLHDAAVLSTTQGPSSLALQLAASDAWIAIITEERDAVTSSSQSAKSMAVQILRDLSVMADQLIFRSHARVSSKELIKLSFSAVSVGGNVARFSSLFLATLLGLRFFSDLPQLRAIVRQCEDRDVAVLAKAVAIGCSQNGAHGRNLFLDKDLEAIFARISTTTHDVQQHPKSSLKAKSCHIALTQRIVAVAVFAVVHSPTVRGAICMCLHDETNLEDEGARVTAAFVAAILSQKQPGILALAVQGRKNSSQVFSDAEGQPLELFKFQQILLWHLSVYNNDL